MTMMILTMVVDDDDDVDDDNDGVGGDITNRNTFRPIPQVCDSLSFLLERCKSLSSPSEGRRATQAHADKQMGEERERQRVQ